jgi:phage terminase large subunit GpA-like protein
VRKGQWKATEEFKGIAGFHINGIYSPWTPLSDAVRDFLSAKKMPETLRVWTNVYLAESWEDQGETVDDYDVAQRAEEFGPRVDSGVVVVTAGIDVQDDRIEVEIVGWGRSEESWSLDYRTLYGDPSTPQLWQDLDAHLAQKWDTEDGRVLQIRSACIDSGGHYTKAVYDFVRPREGRRVFAIKGPGFCHFPNDRPDEYFKQLAASEKIVTKFHKGFPRREFIKTRTRNEALDCRVYATGALAILNLNLDTLADRASQSVRQDEDVPKNTPLRRPQRRGDFVNGWR